MSSLFFQSSSLKYSGIYLFNKRSLEIVVVLLLLLWSYDDGRRIFVNKLGSL